MFVKESYKKNILILLLVSFFLIISYLKITDKSFLHETTPSDKNPEQIAPPLNTTEQNTPSQPTPFDTLTIPYLQNRTYQSSLGEKTIQTTTESYTSYLTSYDSDGNTIYGQLTIPTGQSPEEGWPAVIFIHGYIPPQSYKTFEKYEAYVDYLAQNDLVVFKIDLRGHGNSEGDASGAYYATDYVVDTLNAYDALTKIPEVNREAIYLWGHSMAGNVILKAVVTQPDIPKAVIFAGAVYSYEDFLKYGISDNSYQPPDDDSPRRQRRADLFEKHGQFSPENEFWQQVPATNYLDGVKTEIHLHHAVNDSVVTINYSRDLIPLLKENDIAHQLYEYNSGGHNITGSAFTTAMQRTVDFFTND